LFLPRRPAQAKAYQISLSHVGPPAPAILKRVTGTFQAHLPTTRRTFSKALSIGSCYSRRTRLQTFET
jgi:hypothetical protein